MPDRERETVFGDTVAAVDEDEGGLNVRFERGGERRFDLLVGADGLHSTVRSLVLGTDPRWIQYLGYSAAAFVTSELLEAGRGRVSELRGARTPDKPVLLAGWKDSIPSVFAAPEPIALHRGELETDKRLLRSAFGHDPWIEAPEILSRLGEAQSCTTTQ